MPKRVSSRHPASARPQRVASERATAIAPSALAAPCPRFRHRATRAWSRRSCNEPRPSYILPFRRRHHTIKPRDRRAGSSLCRGGYGRDWRRSPSCARSSGRSAFGNRRGATAPACMRIRAACTIGWQAHRLRAGGRTGCSILISAVSRAKPRREGIIDLHPSDGHCRRDDAGSVALDERTPPRLPEQPLMRRPARSISLRKQKDRPHQPLNRGQLASVLEPSAGSTSY